MPLFYPAKRSVFHMFYARVKKTHAERLRRLLARKSLLNGEGRIKHSISYVYFPVVNEDEKIKKLIHAAGAELVGRKGREIKKRGSFADGVEKARRDSGTRMSAGYDVIGTIAIIDVGADIGAGRVRQLAKELMEENSHVKTVLAKAGAVAGRYRIRGLRYVAGRRNFATVHRENGCSFYMDVRKTFFSPRLAYERARIARLSKGKERVVVMFAGAGPFVVQIAKANGRAEVVGIELNRDSFSYMKRNIELNRLKNARAVFGNVRTVSRRYRNIADRILMPLPMSSMDFLGDAFDVAKTRAVIHLYAFCSSDTLGKELIDRTIDLGRKRGISITLIGKRVVRPYSSKELEMAFDLLVRKKR
jgi:tRNA (guanine37-N1)-methyltransferase